MQRGGEGLRAWGSTPLQTGGDTESWGGAAGQSAHELSPGPPPHCRPTSPRHGSPARGLLQPRSLMLSPPDLQPPSHGAPCPALAPAPRLWLEQAGGTSGSLLSPRPGPAGYLARPGWGESVAELSDGFFVFFFMIFSCFCFWGRTGVDAFALKDVPSNPSRPRPLSRPSLGPPSSLPPLESLQNDSHWTLGPLAAAPRPPGTPYSPPLPRSGPSAPPARWPPPSSIPHFPL